MIAAKALSAIHAATRPPNLTEARADFVRYSNRIAGKKRPLRFAWNGQTTALEFTALDHSLAAVWALKILLGGHAFTVTLLHLPEPGWMAPELAGVDFALLPEDLACGVWQSCLADVNAALARQGLDLQVISFTPAIYEQTAPEHLEWTLSRGEKKHWLRGTLAAGDDAWRHLATFMDKAPVETSLNLTGIPFPVTLSAGSLRCAPALLRRVELHDVLLADVRAYLTQKEVTLFLQGRSFGGARAQDNLITLQRLNFNPIPKNMAQTTPEHSALDDLEVELTFLVGQTTLTLGELRGLAPGASFELTAPVSEAVTIHANGRPIGKGELLEIGDRVGVRVTELKH